MEAVVVILLLFSYSQALSVSKLNLFIENIEKFNESISLECVEDLKVFNAAVLQGKSNWAKESEF
jgi:hypothetical protein